MDARHMLAALGVAVLLGCGPGKGLPLPAGGSSSGASDGTTSEAGTPTAGATMEGSSSTSLPVATTSTTASTSTMSTGTSTSSAPDTQGETNDCFFVDPECEPGMKCAVAGPTCDDYPECVPVGEGEKSLFESCQILGCLGPDDCGPGAYCAFDYSDASPGTCLPACKHGDFGIHCDDPNEQCILLGSAAAIAVCGLVCDVLVQDCPDGMGCVWVGASTGYFSTCVTLADPGGIADPCENPSDCKAGLGCAYGWSVLECSDRCCTPFCALDDPFSCDAVPGTVCEPLGDNFGYCVEPA